MKRCPKCNCGAECLNGFGYYAGQAGGMVIAAVAGLGAGLIHRSSAGHVGSHVYKETTEGLRKKYRCTNSNCGYEWTEK